MNEKRNWQPIGTLVVITLCLSGMMIPVMPQSSLSLFNNASNAIDGEIPEATPAVATATLTPSPAASHVLTPTMSPSPSLTTSPILEEEKRQIPGFEAHVAIMMLLAVILFMLLRMRGE